MLECHESPHYTLRYEFEINSKLHIYFRHPTKAEHRGYSRLTPKKKDGVPHTDQSHKEKKSKHKNKHKRNAKFN